MTRKHSNKRVRQACLVRKKWRAIAFYFCQFGRTYVVNLKKGFGGPNANCTEYSTVINGLCQNQFDLKFYLRSCVKM